VSRYRAAVGLDAERLRADARGVERPREVHDDRRVAEDADRAIPSRGSTRTTAPWTSFPDPAGSPPRTRSPWRSIPERVVASVTSQPSMPCGFTDALSRRRHGRS
jgi:hypothetical protein